MAKKRIGAGAFKQSCLKILDEVRNEQLEVVITKRGEPVARLVPMPTSEELEEELLRSMRGRGRTLVSDEEMLAPTVDDAGWNLEP